MRQKKEDEFDLFAHLQSWSYNPERAEERERKKYGYEKNDPFLLENGFNFQMDVTDTAKEVVFCDRPFPMDKDLYNVSEYGDGHVRAWDEGDTMYVSTGIPGEKVRCNPNCYDMFANRKHLERIDFSGLDTKRYGMMNMAGMFFGCESLRQIDVSSFDTSKCTTMTTMFSGCYVLRNLDLTGWDTRNVKEMSNMFYECIGFRQLDLSSFRTDSLQRCRGMFQRAFHLQVLKLENFGCTENLESEGTEGMFLETPCLYKLISNSFDIIDRYQSESVPVCPNIDPQEIRKERIVENTQPLYIRPEVIPSEETEQEDDGKIEWTIGQIRNCLQRLGKYNCFMIIQQVEIISPKELKVTDYEGKEYIVTEDTVTEVNQ